MAKIAKQHKIPFEFMDTDKGYASYTSAIEIYKDESPAFWHREIERKLKSKGVNLHESDFNRLR